jgi:glycosyltransferase involved in cell wall biosynthesis
MKNLVLSMIVRDEAAVIERCLKAILPWITHWAVVDTGSKDDTVSKVKQTLAGLPGEVTSFSWINDFSAARNVALALAKKVVGQEQIDSTLVLFIDADETVVLDNGLSRILGSRATRAVWHWYVDANGFRSRKLAVAPLAAALGWIGARHEYLNVSPDIESATFRDVLVRYGDDGFRRRNSATLNEDLVFFSAENVDFRSLFFRARTFEQQERFSEAATVFESAKKLSPSSDWFFACIWGQARCAHKDSMLCAHLYHAALEHSPHRAEPMAGLARIALDANRLPHAIALCTLALGTNMPVDSVMYDHAAYSWLPHDLLSLSYARQHKSASLERALHHCDRALDHYWIPANERRRIQVNRTSIARALNGGRT